MSGTPRWLRVFWERYAWSAVDQREVQRLGGVCARHPYSCFVAAVVDAYVGLGRGPRVADLTYGVGRFYAAWRDLIGYLAAIDVRRWDWVVEPDVFLEGDFAERYRDLPAHGFDVVVFDPPFATKPTSRIRRSRRVEYYYYAIRGLPEMFAALPAAAAHLLAPGGIVLAKIMDARANGTLVYEASHIALIEEMVSAGYRVADILVFKSIASKIRFGHEEKHFTKSHSYVIVFTLDK